MSPRGNNSNLRQDVFLFGFDFICCEHNLMNEGQNNIRRMPQSRVQGSLCHMDTHTHTHTQSVIHAVTRERYYQNMLTCTTCKDDWFFKRWTCEPVISYILGFWCYYLCIMSGFILGDRVLLLLCKHTAAWTLVPSFKCQPAFKPKTFQRKGK